MDYRPKLIELLKGQFDNATKYKGKEYFRQDRVTFKNVDGQSASFKVLGSRSYEVEIQYLKKTDKFNMTCSCPQFAQGINCKHQWASALEFDSLQLLERFNDTGVVGPIPLVNSEKDLMRPHWQESIDHARRKIEKNRNGNSYRKTAAVKSANLRLGSYAVDVLNSSESGQVHLKLYSMERLRKGGLGALKDAELTHAKIELYEDATEREFLWDLIGRTELITSYYGYASPFSKINSIAMTTGHASEVLMKISDAGKLFRMKSMSSRNYGTQDRAEMIPYLFENQKWNFRLVMTKEEESFLLDGEFYSDIGETRSLSQSVGSTENFIFFLDTMAGSDLRTHAIWHELIKARPLLLDGAELDSFLEYFWSLPGLLPPLEIPEEVLLSEVRDVQPIPRASFEASKSSSLFLATVEFKYQDKMATHKTGKYVYNVKAREKILRNPEQEALRFSEFLSCEPISSEDSTVTGSFSSQNFLNVVEKLMNMGWEVYAKDQKLAKAQDFNLQFSSGVDWFDVSAEIKFGEEVLTLPELLRALKSGEQMVPLGNGSMGVLPQDWLKRFAPLMGVAKPTEEGLRLTQLQALFLSASFGENEKFQSDQKFQSLKTILTDLKEMTVREPSKKFKGQLRSYQKMGLAWLSLLSKHNIGGILADDMGLGKTIQILALLSENLKSKVAAEKRPTLILAPKTLVFNWQNEAKKFTPHLKVLNYTGPQRQGLIPQFKDCDLILTTYQSLRIDIEQFQKYRFNYLILDEAHYLKNSQAQITMAAKLITADNKIALTGTPVENSLMDIFSILSVVTPGLVAPAQAQRWAKESDPESLQTLAKALRPFVLRRTKDQVLKDLPAKSEQVLFCELSETERKKYDELKTFYWAQISGKIEEKGLGKSKIEVLEALLRLRQAACHHGLLDARMANARSAKFELVLEQIDSLLAEGHKVLVFSQFTSLLGLFAKHLKHIKYEYLDGQTNDRAKRVENFQTDPDCKVFLLSLKAGGVGLNLTAADYVFILDPWWNPASESQAIDRAHRIGQTKKVFAYKIIAKDTIEEKILAMQEKKKRLASAVISNDASLFKNLKFDDLKKLFE